MMRRDNNERPGVDLALMLLPVIGGFLVWAFS